MTTGKEVEDEWAEASPQAQKLLSEIKSIVDRGAYTEFTYRTRKAGRLIDAALRAAREGAVSVTRDEDGTWWIHLSVDSKKASFNVSGGGSICTAVLDGLRARGAQP